MATLGETVGGVLGEFSFIFIFLLVFAICFGILSYVNPLKDEKKGLYAIFSFVLAILVSISSGAVTFIRTMTVWFFVLGLFIFLLIFVFGIFGLKEKDWSVIVRNSNVHSWVIIIAIVIALFAFGSAFGQKLLEQGTGTPTTGTGTGTGTGGTTTPITNPGTTTGGNSFADNVLATFVHPKVLGLILVFMIGLFTMVFLTKPSAM